MGLKIKSRELLLALGITLLRVVNLGQMPSLQTFSILPEEVVEKEDPCCTYVKI